MFETAFSQRVDDQSQRLPTQFPFRMVRTPRYKLIRWTDSRRPDEFYDLVRDPQERENLIRKSEFQAVRVKLSQQLDRWIKRTERTVEKQASSGH